MVKPRVIRKMMLRLSLISLLIFTSFWFVTNLNFSYLYSEGYSEYIDVNPEDRIEFKIKYLLAKKYPESSQYWGMEDLEKFSKLLYYLVVDDLGVSEESIIAIISHESWLNPTVLNYNYRKGKVDSIDVGIGQVNSKYTEDRLNKFWRTIKKNKQHSFLYSIILDIFPERKTGVWDVRYNRYLNILVTYQALKECKSLLQRRYSEERLILCYNHPRRALGSPFKEVLNSDYYIRVNHIREIFEGENFKKLESSYL